MSLRPWVASFVFVFVIVVRVCDLFPPLSRALALRDSAFGRQRLMAIMPDVVAPAAAQGTLCGGGRGCTTLRWKTKPLLFGNFAVVVCTSCFLLLREMDVYAHLWHEL